MRFRLSDRLRSCNSATAFQRQGSAAGSRRSGRRTGETRAPSSDLLLLPTSGRVPGGGGLCEALTPSSPDRPPDSKMGRLMEKRARFHAGVTAVGRPGMDWIAPRHTQGRPLATSLPGPQICYPIPPRPRSPCGSRRRCRRCCLLDARPAWLKYKYVPGGDAAR